MSFTRRDSINGPSETGSSAALRTNGSLLSMDRYRMEPNDTNIYTSDSFDFGGGDEQMDSISSSSDTGSILADAENQFDHDKRKAHQVLSAKHMGWQRRLQDALEGNPHHKDVVLAIVVNVVVLAAIIASCIIFCVESLPQYHDSRGEGLSGLAMSGFFWGETTCIAIFVAEAILRVVVVPWKDLKNIFFAVDVVSILGYFVDLTLDAAGTGFSGIGIVRALRLIRVFRIFKLSRYSKSLQLVFVVLKSSAGGLTILLVPLVLAITLYSTAIYFFEIAEMEWDGVHRKWNVTGSEEAGEIQSIPDAFWFAMATITTVGYGDVLPRSVGGRIIAVMIQFTGVLTLSFPNIVLGGNMQFTFRAYHKVMARKKLGRKFRKVYNMILFFKLLRDMMEERKVLRQAGGTVLLPSGQPGVSVEAPGNGTASPDSAPLAGDGTDSMVSSTNPQINLESSLASESKSKSKKAIKNTANYHFSNSEFLLYRKEDVPVISSRNIREWNYKGLTASTLLQRILETASGVCTTEELFRSYNEVEDTRVHLKDIAVVALYLAQAEYLQAFMFRRSSTIFLVALTQQSVQELLLHPEECRVSCIRSAETARYVWRRTTSTTVSFSLQPLFSTYLRWKDNQDTVDDSVFTPNTDLRATQGRRPGQGAGSGKSSANANAGGWTPNIAGLMPPEGGNGSSNGLTPYYAGGGGGNQGMMTPNTMGGLTPSQGGSLAPPGSITPRGSMVGGAVDLGTPPPGRMSPQSMFSPHRVPTLGIEPATPQAAHLMASMGSPHSLSGTQWANTVSGTGESPPASVNNTLQEGSLRSNTSEATTSVAMLHPFGVSDDPVESSLLMSNAASFRQPRGDSETPPRNGSLTQSPTNRPLDLLTARTHESPEETDPGRCSPLMSIAEEATNASNPDHRASLNISSLNMGPLSHIGRSGSQSAAAGALSPPYYPNGAPAGRTSMDGSASMRLTMGALSNQVSPEAQHAPMPLMRSHDSLHQLPVSQSGEFGASKSVTLEDAKQTMRRQLAETEAMIKRLGGICSPRLKPSNHENSFNSLEDVRLSNNRRASSRERVVTIQ